MERKSELEKLKLAEKNVDKFDISSKSELSAEVDVSTSHLVDKRRLRVKF